VTRDKVSQRASRAGLAWAIVSPMVLIRWFDWGDGPVIPVYPGAEPLPDVPLLGVTVADAEALRVMGELLVAWADTAPLEAH